MYSDLRDFLRQLESRGELKRIEAAVSPRLKAWVEPAATGPGQRIVVEVDASTSTGRFSDDVVLKTSSTAQPTLTVKVLGTIDG